LAKNIRLVRNYIFPKNVQGGVYPETTGYERYPRHFLLTSLPRHGPFPFSPPRSNNRCTHTVKCTRLLCIGVTN